MIKRQKLKDHLLISSLAVMRSDYDNAHHFEAKNRTVHGSFGYILKGRVEFSMLAEKIYAEEGDLIFVPEGLRYISHWEGTPQISFISIQFRTDPKSTAVWRALSLQKIEGEKVGRIGELICEMEKMPDRFDADQLHLLSKFYEIAALAFPYMKKDAESAPPAVLQTAINYIEKNYASISSVQEIAQACYLSESRLFHLFQDHLRTTPVSYLNRLRIQAAMELLKTTDLSIQEVAERLNFHSEYYFRKTFQKIAGVLPSYFRKTL